MKENKPIGQYNPDGDQRKRRGGVIILQGNKQGLVPLIMGTALFFEFKALKGTLSRNFVVFQEGCDNNSKGNGGSTKWLTFLGIF